MQQCVIAASVHRFHDYVAISLDLNRTIYLKPEDVRAMSAALNECADNIINVPRFVNSNFGTRSFEFDGKSAT